MKRYREISCLTLEWIFSSKSGKTHSVARERARNLMWKRKDFFREYSFEVVNGTTKIEPSFKSEWTWLHNDILISHLDMKTLMLVTKSCNDKIARSLAYIRDKKHFMFHTIFANHTLYIHIDSREITLFGDSWIEGLVRRIGKMSRAHCEFDESRVKCALSWRLDGVNSIMPVTLPYRVPR